MNGKRIVIGFLAVVLAFITGFTVFGWGMPMTENSSTDVKIVTNLLEKTDTTNAKVTNLVFSPVEEINDKSGKVIDIQSVKYDLISPDTTTSHFVVLKVHKGFIKYRLEGIYELVK